MRLHRQLLGGALLFALVRVFTPSDASSLHYRMDYRKNTQHYGSCAVATSVDLFADEETHSLFCLQIKETDPATGVPKGLHIGYSSKGFFIQFSNGLPLQAHKAKSLSVVIRIDRNPLIIKRSTIWNPEGGTSVWIFNDKRLAHQLLYQLAHGQHMAIQIGNQRSYIKLDGSHRAVADFRHRAGLPPQTLNIPSR